jgi:hypothetical protein
MHAIAVRGLASAWWANHQLGKRHLVSITKMRAAMFGENK